MQVSWDSDSDERLRRDTSSVGMLRERLFPNEDAQANREERLIGVSGTHMAIHFQCELCCGRLLEGLVIRPDDTVSYETQYKFRSVDTQSIQWLLLINHQEVACS